MRVIRQWILVFPLIMLLFAAGGQAAHAQYGFRLPTAVIGRGPNQPAATHAGNISLYPYAQFNASAGGVSASATGILIAAEEVFGQSKGAYAFGGWYWNRYKSDPHVDVYELHAKYYFSQQVGIQGGTVRSTTFGGAAYDVFLLGNLDSSRYSPGASHPWAIQAGVGPFIDTSGNQTTTDFTGFVAGSIGVWGKVSLDASYWYVKDRGGNLNRIAVGVGYKV